MPTMSFVSQTSIKLKGRPIPGAEDRQHKIVGFDQAKYSRSHVLLVGAGGLASAIAPTVVRKGIGKITILDDDLVEVSNLNRQRFYECDIGTPKATALARSLQPECIAATDILGLPLRFQEAVARDLDLSCDVAVCGVDNNPARVAVGQFFGEREIPVIFTAVSGNGDHGYVFVQEPGEACLACLFPDIADDDRYPCPGTPAIADILQAVGALTVYAIDTILTTRIRKWNYRRLSLSDGAADGFNRIVARTGCSCRVYKGGK